MKIKLNLCLENSNLIEIEFFFENLGLKLKQNSFMKIKIHIVFRNENYLKFIIFELNLFREFKLRPMHFGT